jgi:hypothetical protein
MHNVDFNSCVWLYLYLIAVDVALVEGRIVICTHIIHTDLM